MSDEHTGPASAGKYTERDGRGDEIDRMAAERDEAVACRNRFKGLWEDVTEARKFEADTNAALKNEIASMALRLADTTEGREAHRAGQVHLQRQMEEASKAADETRAHLIAERDAMTGQRETIAAQLTQRTAERDEADRRVDRLREQRSDLRVALHEARGRVLTLEARELAAARDADATDAEPWVCDNLMKRRSQARADAGDWQDKAEERLTALEDNAHCPEQEEVEPTIAEEILVRSSPYHSPQCPSCSHWDNACTSSLLAAIDRRGRCSRFEHKENEGYGANYKARLAAGQAKVKLLEAKLEAKFANAVKMKQYIAEQLRAAVSQADIIAALESEAESQADHICELDRLIARLRSQRDALRQAQPSTAPNGPFKDVLADIFEDTSAVAAALTEPELAQQCQMCEGCASPVAVDHEAAGSCLKWRQQRHPEPYRGLDQEARNAAWVARGELIESARELKAMEDDGLDNDESHMAACDSVQAWSAAWVALRGA